MHELLIIAGAAVLASIVIGTGKRVLLLVALHMADKEALRNPPSGIIADDVKRD
jgi:hypothetical protein